MNKLARLFAIVLLISVLAACTPFQPLAASTTAPSGMPVPPSETPTAEAIPATETPSALSATPTHALETAQAKVSVTALNLRSGPGTTFTVLERLSNDTPLTVLGKAPGGQWIYVDTGKQKGWVAIDFTSIFGKDLVNWLPEMTGIGNTTIIQGKVVDQSGQPISLIGFALVQGAGQEEKRTDAISLPNGRFYFYLPSNATGSWTFSLVSYDCLSRVMDSSCKITGTFQPTIVQFTLPEIPDLTVTFSK